VKQEVEMAARTVTIRFVEERETKNTIRFAEVPRDPAKPDELAIGTLYVRKATIVEATRLGVPVVTPLEMDVTLEFRKR
jgi:hypothetical protein